MPGECTAEITALRGSFSRRVASGAHPRVETLSSVPMLQAMTIEEIVEETRLWPNDLVAELVDRIMLAKHGVDDPALTTAWRSAVARRVEDIRSGKIEGIPGEVVSARIRNIVGR